MSLEKWTEYGWLKAEPTSREEIRGLLEIVSRDLRDAHFTQISEDRRFEAAFNAARTAANIALRASGYRAVMQLGHHLKTIESMEFTIEADPKLIQKLRVFSKKRNATSYDFAGNVSNEEMEQMIKVAAELQLAVSAWLRRNHSHLTGDPQ
jgi:hypothetical protein